MRALVTLGFVIMAVAEPGFSDEQLGSLQLPKELKAAEIEDKAGAEIPLDIAMTDQDGRQVTLGHYLNAGDDRPIILTLGYYGCEMLCSPVLKALVEGLKGLNFTAGKEFRILSASIDEREKPELAKKKQADYLLSLGVGDSSAWIFHVMSKEEARRLGDAVGFNYVYDQRSDQFAHGAGIFVISPTKRILSRTLFGISFKPQDLKLALGEAADGNFGSFVDRVLLSCFHYDPDSHRYGIYVMGVMRLGGILTMLILGAVLVMYFRSERKSAKSVV
ncbi:MAG TPA: SCO family protein [Myxococcota bacterium]|nr:SCO family protein [Myxococcota bacterium]